MNNFIGHHRALTPTDFLELALGTPVDLWLGEEGESAEETAARLAAARDILADDPAIADRTAALAVETIGRTLPELLTLAPARPVVPVRRRKGRAAA